MAFNFKRLPRCGAKAKSREGKPCQQAVVMNGSGRCYWHGGAKSIKHGRYTAQAIRHRKEVRTFIRECKQNLSFI
jgi:anthranilate phosphoribosyltransferase